jgi:tetratricopeptide (TPR) repeat protein
LQYERELTPAGAVHFGLEPLTIEAAVEAIRSPMGRAGGRFAASSAEYIADELRDASTILNKASVVQPTQLQVICTELWHIAHADLPLITVGFVRDNINVDRILTGFCANVIMEVSDRHQIAADRVFNWLVLGFLSSNSNSVESPEAELTAIGIPVGVLRMLENEHLLIAGWNLDSKRYRLANDHLIAALRYLGKSPVFGQPKLDNAARLQVAESAVAAGELALARYHAEEALKSGNPSDIRFRADVLSLIGNIEYQLGRTDLAVENYSDAAKLHEQLGDHSGVGRLFGAIGCIHASQGEYFKALEELQLAVTRSPSDLALQTELAMALWRLGHSQAAAAVFGAVLSVEPESRDALAGRGQIRAERGNAMAALDDLQTLRRIHPRVSQHPEVQSAYALALASKGLSETAMAEAEAALGSASDSAVIFLRAARVALASGAMKRAKVLLRQAEVARHPALSSDQFALVRRLLTEVGESGSSRSMPNA